jgi:hypothetical protein
MGTKIVIEIGCEPGVNLCPETCVFYSLANRFRAPTCLAFRAALDRDTAVDWRDTHRLTVFSAQCSRRLELARR